MPCYTRQKASIVLRAENFDVLLAALQADAHIRVLDSDRAGIVAIVSGQKVSVVRQKDRLTVVTDQQRAADIANTINRAYSREVVQRQAKRFGWKLATNKDGSITARKKIGMALVLFAVGLGAVPEAHAHHEEIVAVAPAISLWVQYALAALAALVSACGWEVKR